MARSSGDEAPELPGMYYDRERRRYYRILPGLNNHNPLTQRMISEKKAEEAESSKPSQDDKQSKYQSVNMMRLVEKRKSGTITSTKFFEESISTRLDSLSSNSPFPAFQNHCTSEIVYCIITDFKYGKIIARHAPSYSVRNHEAWLSGRGIGSRISSCSKDSVFCFVRKYGGVMFSDLSTREVTLLDIASNRRRYGVQCSAPHTCASSIWSQSTHVASYSDGRFTVLISNIVGSSSREKFHPRGGPGYSVVRMASDVLSQQFGARHHAHYNGLRGGAVIGLDTRTSLKDFCCTFDAPIRSNARHIRTLSDGCTVLVGYENPGADPKMYLWDVRFSKQPMLELLTSFEKRRHVDPAILPLFTMNVDAYEKTVTAVLPDCRARTWSLKTGKVLLLYPEDKKDGTVITAAAYSNDWELYYGRCGILMYEESKGYGFLNFAAES